MFLEMNANEKTKNSLVKAIDLNFDFFPIENDVYI